MIRFEQVIACFCSLKPTNTPQNLLKLCESLEHKWKERESLSAQKLILKLKLNRISIRTCGKNEEKKQPFTSKERFEAGEREDEHRSLRSKRKKSVFSSQKKKKNIAAKKRPSIRKKSKGEHILEQKMILIFSMTNLK